MLLDEYPHPLAYGTYPGVKNMPSANPLMPAAMTCVCLKTHN